MSEYEYIEVESVGDVTVVQLANPNILDRLLIYELGDELIDFVEKQKPEKLLIDFQKVTYCSSEVIGGLIRTRSRVVPDGRQMKLCSMNRDIRKLFKITHLDGTVFTIYDSADEAISAF